MLNQQEERSLSIGSAVQFTHKGETIHGHLLERQGRRRGETETWRVDRCTCQAFPKLVRFVRTGCGQKVGGLSHGRSS